MNFSVDVTDNSDQIILNKNAVIKRVLVALGLHLEGEAKDELENDPHRVDTGRLKNSISNRAVEDEEAVYIGTNVEYAPYVHEGTRRMVPNRFLKNAVEKNMTQIKEYIQRELKG